MKKLEKLGVLRHKASRPIVFKHLFGGNLITVGNKEKKL